MNTLAPLAPATEATRRLAEAAARLITFVEAHVADRIGSAR